MKLDAMLRDKEVGIEISTAPKHKGNIVLVKPDKDEQEFLTEDATGIWGEVPGMPIFNPPNLVMCKPGGPISGMRSTVSW
jgi:hypothetical protein